MDRVRLRDLLHEELATGFRTHHQDPIVQQLAGLRRVGAAVYDLEQEMDAAEAAAGGRDLRRARCYFAAAECLVTFADAFVLDAFADPAHPRHIPHVTFVQAQAFYLKIPDLVTATRQELSYAGSATTALPALPGQRYEAARCPIEHLLAMQRAAAKVEDLIGTRVESLKLHSAGREPAGLRPAVLLMTEARTKRDAGDRTIGALRAGQSVPAEEHEQAEAFYYDGVLRAYLYAAQELELPGVTAAAPHSEQPPEEPAPAPQPAFPQRSAWQPPMSQGLGIGLGQLITADVVAGLVGNLLGGLFGGGGGWGEGGWGGGGRGWW